MRLHEQIRPCSVCEELTPHSRRVIALPHLLVAVLCCLALALFALGGWPLGVLPVGAAVLVLAYDRERCWSVACERCRLRARAAARRTKPRFDGSTEIHLG